MVMDIFKCIFFKKKKNFDSTFIEIHSSVSNWQQVSKGSGIGLALNRCHAISWTNDEPVY